MSDVKWVKIVTDVFDDEKILLIESMPEADSIIVVWFKLLCLAGKQNNGGVFVLGDRIPYTEKMLATIFRRKETVVQMALKTFEKFGMIEIINDTIVIPKWEKHQNIYGLDKIREDTRLRVAKHREKQKSLLTCNVTSNDTVTHSNALEEEEEEEEEKRNNKYNVFFDSVWELYPNKKGKASVKQAQRKKLYAIGYDKLAQAIENYKGDKEDWKAWQNGSTFFNTTYQDYMLTDEVLEKVEERDKYDFDEY